jgi:excinuclease UvrABC ATPase subunit
LNFEIMNLHDKYSSENIENNLIDVIIDHMKCVDSYNISGKEKKEMVLNSIETLLSTNDMRSDNKKILRNLSSKLIDTFYSLDKHKINISEKLPSTFSCFPR